MYKLIDRYNSFYIVVMNSASILFVSSIEYRARKEEERKKLLAEEK